jgi:hypothetical protein
VKAFRDLCGDKEAPMVDLSQPDSRRVGGAMPGSNQGFGWYRLSDPTPMVNTVPAGWAPEPGDFEGTARKNDGTGCSGAHEC